MKEKKDQLGREFAPAEPFRHLVKRKLVRQATPPLMALLVLPKFLNPDKQGQVGTFSQAEIVKIRLGIVFETLARVDPNLPRNKGRMAGLGTKLRLRLRDFGVARPDMIIFSPEPVDETLVIEQLVEIKLGLLYNTDSVLHQLRRTKWAFDGLSRRATFPDLPRPARRIALSPNLSQPVFIPAESGQPPDFPHPVIHSIFSQRDVGRVTDYLMGFIKAPPRARP